jgi:hypothetical protein
VTRPVLARRALASNSPSVARPVLARRAARLGLSVRCAVGSREATHRLGLSVRRAAGSREASPSPRTYRPSRGRFSRGEPLASNSPSVPRPVLARRRTASDLPSVTAPRRPRTSPESSGWGRARGDALRHSSFSDPAARDGPRLGLSVHRAAGSRRHRLRRPTRSPWGQFTSLTYNGRP